MDRQETLKASVVRKAGENWIINSSFWKRLLPLSIESPFPLKVSMVPFRPSLKYSSTEALLMLIREVAMLICWLKEIFLSVSKRQSCKKMNQFKFSCSAKFIFRNQTHAQRTKTLRKLWQSWHLVDPHSGPKVFPKAALVVTKWVHWVKTALFAICQFMEHLKWKNLDYKSSWQS